MGRLLPLLAACLAAPLACRAPAEADAARVEAQLREALAAFEAAQRRLDAEAVIAVLAPDFTMLQDGVRVGHDATVAQIRATLPSLRALHTRFDDVEVHVLGPDTALTSMRFDDVVTDADGSTVRTWGPSTMLWRRRDGRWRLVFADSDHYPGEPPAP